MPDGAGLASLKASLSEINDHGSCCARAGVFAAVPAAARSNGFVTRPTECDASSVNEYGGDTLRSNWSNSPYRRNPGRSSPPDQSAIDLVDELAGLIVEKYGRPRRAHDQHFAPRGAGSPRRDAYHAGTPDNLHDGYSQSHSRYHHVSQFAGAEEFDRHREDHHNARDAGAARAERNHRVYFSHGAPTGPHDEEYDDPPRRSRRSSLVPALALIGCVTVGTAGAYAYWTSYFGPGSTQSSGAPSPAKRAQGSARDAPPAAAANAAAGGYVVQVSARRSKADAQASFRSLQEKFPRQLGGWTAIVRRADLGAKGIYYRAMVGPFASAGEAGELCGSLKAAGGECIIQRN